jgi:hypothetical protein
MDSATKQDFVRRLAARGQPTNVLWSRHAIGKLALEDLSRQAVEAALCSSEVIEDYPVAHRPLPDCLLLGHLSPAAPIHVVAAIDEPNDRLFIVTLYRPDPARWTHDSRTRRR